MAEFVLMALFSFAFFIKVVVEHPCGIAEEGADDDKNDGRGIHCGSPFCLAVYLVNGVPGAREESDSVFRIEDEAFPFFAGVQVGAEISEIVRVHMAYILNGFIGLQVFVEKYYSHHGVFFLSF